MRDRRALAAAFLLLLSLAAWGCSGGEGEGAPLAGGQGRSAGSAPEVREDQSRWAEQVDEACAEWQEQIDAIPPPSNEADLDRTLAAALPLIRGQIDAVRAVKPSADEEEARLAGLFIAGLRRTERAMRRYLEAVRGSDPEAVKEVVAAVNAAGSQTRAYAVALNLSRCGAGSG